MKYSATSVTGSVEILATDDYQAIPIKLTANAKAGMPITSAGAPIAAGTGAVGILLYDVNVSENPNAAIVVSGIVNWTKCMSNSGATATAATMAGILPAITFRTNIGVNT